ncbi:MAG: hypothetical protein OQK82_07045, partial [Candidatus Pacearchaeota archaeon]|nr:hypothetical protein [Candidatus Pacearchaeota archaeon]
TGSNGWIQREFINPYDKKTVSYLGGATLSTYVKKDYYKIMLNGVHTVQPFQYDTIYFALSLQGQSGVIVAEKKVFMNFIDGNKIPSYVPNSTNKNMLAEFQQNQNQLPFKYYYDLNSIYSVASGVSVALASLTPSLPKNAFNFNDVFLSNYPTIDIKGGITSTSGLKLLSQYEDIRNNQQQNISNVVEEFNKRNIFSNVKIGSSTYKSGIVSTSVQGLEIKSEDGKELNQNPYTPLYSDKYAMMIVYYVQKQKNYIVDKIANDYILIPVTLEYASGGNSGNGSGTGGNNSGNGSDSGNNNNSNNSNSGGSSSGGSSNSGTPSGNTGAGSTGSNNGNTELISRIEAMKSGFYGTLGRLRGTNDFIDKDGNVWEEIIIDGTTYIRKKKSTDGDGIVLNEDNSSTNGNSTGSSNSSNKDFSKLRFSCDGNEAKCAEKYKNCPDAIYISEDYLNLDAMAQSRGGSWREDFVHGRKYQYIEFANGEVWKSVGTIRPVLCPEVKTPILDTPPPQKEMPCCMQVNEQGQLVYFYKGQTYPAKKTTQGEYVADLGEGWRFIEDCIPIEPQKEPQPCETQIKELVKLRNEYNALESELIKARANNNDDYINSLIKEIDSLRKQNLKNENDLINNYSDGREEELQEALKKSNQRNKELMDEIEMLKKNDKNSLESFYNYCCNDFDDCCDCDEDY